MRGWKLFFPFFMVALSVLLMGNSQLQQTGLPLKDVSSTSILKKELSLQEEKNFGNIILLPYSKYDEQETAAIINRLNKLPQSLIKKIDQKGVKLQLFTGKLTDNKTVKGLAGIIPRGYQSNTTWDNVPGVGGGQTVFVKIGASNKGNGHGSVNLEYHELAHSIDSKILAHASKTNQYLAVWNKEKFVLFPNKPYFQNYAEEYFAETFAMFYVGGAEKLRLKSVAPLTYQYISRIK